MESGDKVGVILAFHPLWDPGFESRPDPSRHVDLVFSPTLIMWVFPLDIGQGFCSYI